MSASYLLLKENKPDAFSQSPSTNQTSVMEDANASSTPSTLLTLEWDLSTFLILTLILFSINVLLKLIEKGLDYLSEKIHTYVSKKKNSEAKESNSASSNWTQSHSKSSKDPQ